MTDVDIQSQTPRFFYGWTIVGTVFAILTVTSGLGFYNASVILTAGTDELNVSVGAVSGATALFFGISGVTGFLLSRQMDSRDMRYFYIAGGVLGAAALWSLRWVDTVARLYAFFAVFGVGFALAGLVPGTTLVTRWFDRRRSVALSVASTGLSLGGIAITPISAWLIDQRGLAGAAPYMAVSWLVGVVPIGVLLIRSRPSDMGLEPDGVRPASVEGPDVIGARADTIRPDIVDGADGVKVRVDGVRPEPVRQMDPTGATFAEARRTRFFIMMSVTYALIFFAQVGGLAHLFNLASERVDKTTAGTALSVLALTSVVGRLLGGLIVLRVSTRVLATALTLFQAGALLVLAFSFSSISIIGGAVLFGISVGNLLMLQPLLLAEAFGVAEYSRIYSSNQLISTIGVGGGPVVLGLVHDVGDYRTAFVIAAIASVFGFATFILAGPVRDALAVARAR